MAGLVPGHSRFPETPLDFWPFGVLDYSVSKTIKFLGITMDQNGMDTAIEEAIGFSATNGLSSEGYIKWLSRQLKGSK